MGRGGIRKGAGRKAGQRDTKPRTRGIVPQQAKVQDLELFDRFNKGFYLKIKSMLSTTEREEYERLVGKGEDPIECLKFLLQDLMVRYKKGRVMEIKAQKTWEGISKVVDNITKVAETINKIESDRPTSQINVLMLLTDASNVAKANAVGEALFADPDNKEDIIDVLPEEQSDGDLNNESEDKSGNDDVSTTDDEETEKKKEPRKKKTQKKKER